MNKILQEDINNFGLNDSISEKLRDSKIIVTGSTGLIGSTFVRCVNSLGINVSFILPVRDAEKACKIYEKGNKAITIIQSDLKDFFKNISIGCDYIVHCASPTNGQYMKEHPADTFLLAVESTKSILDYASQHKIKGVVYVSSIEYYGQIFDDLPITENMNGLIDHQSSRNSYALGKQAAEYLCFCYAYQYGVPVKIARLTQTFGAGISNDDNRVFAQFARSVIDGTDIVLHTEGRSAKPYCYTTDCISALLYILIRGKNGEAYNVATPGTYLTIRELAELYRDNFNPDIEVKVQLKGDGGYAPETKVNLNPDRLMQLGWKPQYNLVEMIRRLLDYLKANI